MKKAVFLDRDGVINEQCSHPELVGKKGKVCGDPLSVDEFKILPGVREAVKEIKKKGYEPVIISNQPGLAKGFFKKEVIEQINEVIKKELGIEHIYYCFHHPDYTGECECHKPKPGLILKAAEELSIDIKESFMVGDKETDIQAGKSAGCKTVLVSEGKEGFGADFVIRKLGEIISLLS